MCRAGVRINLDQVLQVQVIQFLLLLRAMHLSLFVRRPSWRQREYLE
jgi:hypothetical protein